MVIYYVTPHSLTDTNQYFKGTCCLHVQGKDNSCTLKIEPVGCPKTLAPINRSTLYHTPEDHNLNNDHNENIRPLTSILFTLYALASDNFSRYSKYNTHLLISFFQVLIQFFILSNNFLTLCYKFI